MICYLIEYRDPQTGNATGYMRDVDRSNGYDVALTRDANRAIKFTSRSEAQSILDDTAFVHACGHLPLAVAEHMWMDESPPPSAPAEGK